MAKRETKQKLAIPTRAPKARGDMFENLRRPDQVESLSIEEIITPPERDRPTLDHPEPPKTTSGGLRPPKPSTVAPVRDYNKRANVIDRDALPSGLFPGSSKKLYDALYLRTLGAVAPTKTIQATRRELSQWSGIKNVKTIAAHLRHLETVGLVLRAWDRGDNEGSVYEVRLPDGLRPPKTTQGELNPPEVASDQNSALPLGQNSASGGASQPADLQDVGIPGKTSFKTNTERDDDEAFADLLAAERELTGKNASPERWAELVEVLVTELKIAAGRTTVSSVPAFLAEHLRRRLWKKDKRQLDGEGKSDVDQSSATKVDASKCPDCFGTGMWYPEGFEKGVARCRHEKLRAAD